METDNILEEYISTQYIYGRWVGKGVSAQPWLWLSSDSNYFASLDVVTAEVNRLNADPLFASNYFVIEQTMTKTLKRLS